MNNRPDKRINRGFEKINRGVEEINRGVGKINRGVGKINRGVGKINRGVRKINREVGKINRGVRKINREVKRSIEGSVTIVRLARSCKKAEAGQLGPHAPMKSASREDAKKEAKRGSGSPHAADGRAQ